MPTEISPNELIPMTREFCGESTASCIGHSPIRLGIRSELELKRFVPLALLFPIARRYWKSKPVAHRAKCATSKRKTRVWKKCHFSPINTTNTLVPRLLPGNALSWRLCLPQTTIKPQFGRQSLQFIGFPGRAWEPDGGVQREVTLFPLELGEYSLPSPTSKWAFSSYC